MKDGASLSWQVSCPDRVGRRRVRRDRHGRGARGVLVLPILPRYRTRSRLFDDMVITQVQALIHDCPSLSKVEYCVEDVPPSDPAPWESPGCVLGRAFAADVSCALPARVVIYRHPCMRSVLNMSELKDLIHAVLVEQSAQLLGRRPDEIDPHWY